MSNETSKLPAFHQQYRTYAEWLALHGGKHPTAPALRKPTGPLIQRGGYEEPVTPKGYRLYNKVRHGATNYFYWNYEPIPAVQS